MRFSNLTEKKKNAPVQIEQQLALQLTLSKHG